MSPDPLTDKPTESDIVRKDMSESPSSETETEQLQDNPDESNSDVSDDHVKVLPGTGGPDDVGDVEVPDDTVIPRSTGATPAG